MLTHPKLTLPGHSESVYANAFEFGRRDFATGEIYPLRFLNFPPVGLTALGRLTFGFAPNF